MKKENERSKKKFLNSTMETKDSLDINLALSKNGFKYHKDIDKEILVDSSENFPFELPKLNDDKQTVKTNKSTISRKTEVAINDTADFQNIINNNHDLEIDIAHGLTEIEFEAGIEPDEIENSRNLRLRCHASYVYACAHAAYFIAMANKIK
jgi:hypothetical protein